jgi:hypothetical protein
MPWWYYKGKITKPINNGKDIVIIKPGDIFEAPVSAVHDLQRIKLVVDVTRKIEIRLLREKRKKEKLAAAEEKKKIQKKIEEENKFKNNHNEIKKAPRRRPRRSKKKVVEQSVEPVVEQPVEVKLEENKDQSIVIAETVKPEEQQEDN